MGLRNVAKRPLPKHVAIVLDGNGRWAKKRGMPRTVGHQRGAQNLERIAVFASQLGIEVMSVYAFSTENWQRPQTEIDYLMTMPKRFEEQYEETFRASDIKVIFSGRRDRLSEDNIDLLRRVEEESKDRSGMVLNVCLDYGGRDDIVRALCKVKNHDNPIDEATITAALDTGALPPVDLLIRPGGEQRISNFLLWQVAYAELVFIKTPWPAFSKRHLLKAVANYQKRTRRFGGLKGRA